MWFCQAQAEQSKTKNFLSSTRILAWKNSLFLSRGIKKSLPFDWPAPGRRLDSTGLDWRLPGANKTDFFRIFQMQTVGSFQILWQGFRQSKGNGREWVETELTIFLRSSWLRVCLLDFWQRQHSSCCRLLLIACCLLLDEDCCTRVVVALKLLLHLSRLVS